MRLYLVRHPEPDVAPGLCYGRSDVAVPPGRAAAAASLLLPRLPSHAPVYASPAARCAGLAERLAQALEAGPVRYDARLLEMDFGAWEMRRWDDIARSEIDAWAADMAAYRPGSGERVLDAAVRVKAFHDALGAPQGEAIVVCHAGVIRLLLAARMHRAPAAMARAAAATPHRIAHGELLVVDSGPAPPALPTGPPHGRPERGRLQ